ncbi:bifunctional phospho ribosylaminoimidazole carboxamide formyltransferase/IMP cyclohydrolase [Ehrlichia ruminantium]|uniref:bifunctional phosphoribosylaminoimidazolecarboxamide formyltransferase/IMP cyclohydrolase n=1 Tax=Ehrlichia ruminantium TaxID=779 RepID=UPI00004A0D1A|nr:bifunctional phosphoribosylaminoimidazolecarboxamide formyltransferase/IMP cyclohydrolase [Ehrlichia ruminantium]KYW90403.1 bifunctional phosphoribosylaminoimidazolecarboxamide formyltransferase/inosine monophosphate cyclohydrolase [Ehrlichia ruminantium]QLK50916.1 bifunctional phosphoribosylaminoimidazolecarboxamide formyltransferase/IMP cyclohydrolase [Ehrlichia ruminantium]QLK51838.1 bifunctional phosphoribosylaminoimidazolecarboxamide formyltransferase/IMP cyclohydrolase [Ehrlichia rumina
MKINRAIISVYDKTNIVKFAKFLIEQKVEIIATSSTYKILVDAGLQVIEVSDYTKFPEIMDGRVKTLHPKIHGGILSNRNSHTEESNKFNIQNIDLVIVNLYPFSQVASIKTSTDDQIIEQIDIGGITLLRSAAKNFNNVTVLSDINDYDTLQTEMTNNNNETTLSYRKHLAAKAFAITSTYDSIIHNWLNNNTQDILPNTFAIHGNKVQDLRCGENPHQKGAFYSASADKYPLKQLHGKQLSYNNIVDIEAAINIVAEFTEPAAVIIKHSNPCGAATADDITSAYNKAFACDPKSSFGGIVALNREINEEIAEKINQIFIEVVVGPSITDKAIEIIQKKKNVRIILSTEYNLPKYTIKNVSGGFLLQESNTNRLSEKDLIQVTNFPVSPDIISNLLFAWKICKHVKSNAIVIARDHRAIGVGAGQMSRVDSLEIAIKKSQDCTGAVLASDAFFPFTDSILLSASAKISAIIQPGGSLRDQEVIEEANNQKIAMFFTNIRNFYH